MMYGSMCEVNLLHQTKYWTEVLTTQAASKPTLMNLSMDFKIGTPHSIWSTTHASFHDIRKSILKANLITSVFIFQANKSRFNKYTVDPTCPVCGSGAETLQHFLLHCDTLRVERDRWMVPIRDFFTEVADKSHWALLLQDDFRIARFLLDCTNFTDEYPVLKKPHIQMQLEFLTRNLCFDLHRARINALSFK